MLDLKPATRTENGSRIIQASSTSWGLYLELVRLLSHSMVLLGVTDDQVESAMIAGISAATGDDKMQEFVVAFSSALEGADFVALQSDFGYSSIDQAKRLFAIVVLASSQERAEEINSFPNALRAFMHEVG